MDVCASQNEREPLERLQRLFGAPIYYIAPTEKRPRGIYRWNANSRRAIGIMMTIYPLMESRRKRQILDVLNKWKAAPRLGDFNRAKTACPKGHPYDESNTRRLSGNRRGYRQCGRDQERKRYSERLNGASR